ncbi:energy-coupling factor ABC transporter ATP-binding protein [Desulfovirgula thermocuniculi]|uniref:energy-coupling factor ABC transporter ATP-binding protein n=1 Tax=Desulfovirgula thermocuniculi TaxID=348842 RepID=UPI0004116E41|nr:ATP-binding cassette domain-containing protein [Desulfovirgula thermocuniculi]
MKYILEARDLYFTYPDGTPALKGASLAVEEGKRVAILGPNGAGKTTLFLHFNGILRPQKGKVLYAGKEVQYDRRFLKQLRREVGIVFQDPDSQLFSASVFQEVSFGPMNLGLPKEEVARLVEEAMEATEISALRDKPTHLLSYGQKKRVCLAGVLAMKPRVLICDEPTAGLDPKYARQSMELFDRLHQRGTTIILATHDVDLAYSWADYAYFMEGGKVVGEGLPQEVFRDTRLLESCNLTRPWLVEFFELLCSQKVLPEDSSPPRNREELVQLFLAV